MSVLTLAQQHSFSPTENSSTVPATAAALDSALVVSNMNIASQLHFEERA
jgi:hypothetical protein